MNWNKCKNIVIFLLIVINAILLYLNVIKTPSYKMTKGEEIAITSYLTDNNIVLACEMIETYAPMRQLALESGNFSVPIEALFEEPQDVYRTVEFDKTIFIEGNAKAVFENNYMVYAVDRETSAEPILPDDAILMAESFKDNLQLSFADNPMQEIVQTDNYCEITFFESVENTKIFFNYIKIRADKDGVFYCEVSKHNIVGKSGAYRNIYSCDEMLLTLTPILREITDNPEITDIEMGYFIETYPDSAFKSFLSVPFYKVSVKGVEAPFYVHGYTNNVLETK